MKNNTSNEPKKNYIIIFRFHDGVSIINDADSLKDAVCKRYGIEEVDEMASVDLFRKALEGFSDDDVNGIVSTYDRFSDYSIDSVFLIDKKIYDRREMV